MPRYSRRAAQEHSAAQKQTATQRYRAVRALTPDQARALFAAARVARLATADAAGRPHLVPIVFAVDGDVVYSAVDHKPKRTTALRRFANIAQNPAVAVLVDHYDDADWDQLWCAGRTGPVGWCRLAQKRSSAPSSDYVTATHPTWAGRPPDRCSPSTCAAGQAGLRSVLVAPLGRQLVQCHEDTL